MASGVVLGHGVAQFHPHPTPGGIQGSEAGVGLPLKIAGRLKNTPRPDPRQASERGREARKLPRPHLGTTESNNSRSNFNNSRPDFAQQ